MRTRAGGWVTGTAVLVVLIFLGTWFLVAAPAFDEAATTAGQAQDIRDRNVILARENADLRTEFNKLDDYKAELGEIALQVPSRAELGEYTRIVSDLAAATGVFIVDITLGLPQVVTLPTPEVVAPPADAPTTEGEVAPTATEGDAVPAPTEPAAPAQVDGFVAVPFAVTVLAPYPNVSAFLSAMQTGTTRLFLVSALAGATQPASDATGGKPATVPGDVQMTISGFIWVLRDTGVTVPTTDDGTDEEPAEPVMPTTDRNPFLPVVVPAPQ